MATTQINTAYVTVNKMTNLAFAKPGDIITYTLMLNNAGNVAANNVVLTDAIPAGTTFVNGSVTGATGTSPTLTLASPIPAGGNATVTFQVKVGAAVPTPKPLLNNASVAYTYTVDPADPNGATGARNSNTVSTQVNGAIIATAKSADLSYAAPGDVITYTLNLTNSGNADANNVVLTDVIPTGTTFVPGSLTGATGTPPTLTLTGPILAGGNAPVTFQVLVGATIPVPNPLANSASAVFTYTVDTANPNGVNGTSTSNIANTQVNGAIISSVKTVDKAFAEPGDVLTYTIALSNSGNDPANNVVITDAIPAGTTFVAGSVTGATGTPPTLTLTNPITAGGAATVTFQVLVDNTISAVNPIPNNATTAFTFTTDPAEPNGQTGSSDSNTVTTQINSAIVTAAKISNLAFADVGDTVSYTITLTNTGNVAANNVILTDLLPNGVSYVAGSLVVSVAYSGTLASGLTLKGPIAAGKTVTLSFKAMVDAMANPNPVANKVTAAYTYTVDPEAPDAKTAAAESNTVTTIIFRYNFSQQINDLIESVALEQAALAAIANAEGAKIQKMVAINGVTTQDLLCLNKSVSDMMESLSLLEAVLKQKLGVVNCQINGDCM